MKSGNQDGPDIPVPTDNFNGITVAASAKVGGIGAYREVASFNRFEDSFFGFPPNQITFTDLLAPGEGIELTGLGDMNFTDDGTSFAAPHVTGTVALLQEYAEERIMNAGSPHWSAANGNARRHEVMKAVLMNSADKIEDDGMLAPVGSFLGMERTVLDLGGDNWLDSNAFSGPNHERIPLDIQMGAGHLNASRALTQFRSGEWEPGGGDVAMIGWDYATGFQEEDINKYVLSQPLQGGSYVSLTLAWDREVLFDIDGGTANVYDIGDTFLENLPINSLHLYLLPKGAVDKSEAVAASTTFDNNIQHIFAEVQQGGEYEIWVEYFSSAFGLPQNYAVAWWTAAATTPTALGDYNGDTVVDIQDYNLWRSSFGSMSALAADGNGNNVIDAADYAVWRDNLGATLGAGSVAAVPEPGSVALMVVAVGVVGALSRKRRGKGLEDSASRCG